MDTENKKELIGEIEQRLQIVITVMMFFPVLLDALFRLSGDKPEGYGISVVYWGSATATYLAFYILFSLRKKHIHIAQLSAISFLTLASLVPLVVLMIVFAKYPIKMPPIPQIMLWASMYWVYIAPLAIIVVLFWDKIVNIFETGHHSGHSK
jgi:hypothetical protein